MVVLISYDLRHGERSQSYRAVQDVIEAKSRSYVKALYSQWLVDGSFTALEWRRALRGATDSDDLVLVIEVTPATRFAGYLDTAAIEWLQARGIGLT